MTRAMDATGTAGPGFRSLRGALSMMALLGLAACADPTTSAGNPDVGPYTTLPESVTSIAAPYQNLAAARLQSDGCYWYRHEGPVETTMLPLRTADGNPICTREQETPL